MIKLFSSTFFASCALVLSIVSATAVTVNVETLTRTDGEPLTIITLDGEFAFGDQQKFIDAALRADNAVVMLNSPGGSTIAGIEIGKAIRLKGFATLVPDGFTCASACALAWLGGVPRFMSERARVGFHATSETQSGHAEVSSVGNAAVGAYLNQLGLPLSAVAYISEAQPSDIQWLSFSDARRVGIAVEPFETADTPTSPSGTSEGRPRPEWAAKGDWIQTYSRSDIADAIALATDMSRRFNNASVFRYDNGWYVVALGPYPEGSGRALLESYIEAGSIPADSRLNSGARFEQQVWTPGQTATSDPADAAMAAARTFFEKSSEPNSAALDYLDRLYPPQVLYYGKIVSKDEVMSEKKAFIERWPERTYSTVPGTLNATCDPVGPSCSVSGMITFRAYSASRNETSSGTASFALGFRGPNNGALVSEDGKVMSRDKHKGK